MVLNLAPTKKEIILEQESYSLEWRYLSITKNHMVCKACFIYWSITSFYFYVSFTINCSEAKWFDLYFNTKGNPNICNSLFPCI